METVDMENKKGEPIIKARDAVAGGALAGGFWVNSSLSHGIVSDQVNKHFHPIPNVPGFTAKDATTLAGGTLGALGAAAAYHLVKKGGKAVMKLVNKSKEKSDGN